MFCQCQLSNIHVNILCYVNNFHDIYTEGATGDKTWRSPTLQSVKVLTSQKGRTFTDFSQLLRKASTFNMNDLCFFWIWGAAVFVNKACQLFPTNNLCVYMEKNWMEVYHLTGLHFLSKCTDSYRVCVCVWGNVPCFQKIRGKISLNNHIKI